MKTKQELIELCNTAIRGIEAHQERLLRCFSESDSAVADTKHALACVIACREEIGRFADA